jgi:fructokinase
MSIPILVAIEGGGTKFVCAVGTQAGEILAENHVPTTTPAETLGEVIAFLQEQERELGRFGAIGIASFGPLDPRPASPTYGKILPTPKPGWTNADIVGQIRAAFDIPIAFDTDVNGAALGEWRWGAARALDTFIYLTIGTGIGGGGLINNQLMHGLIHPEMGHIKIPHNFASDPFEGICPFHKDCFEGLASGPAIQARWGQPAETLSPDHPAWKLEAHYIALALANYIYTLSPLRIIIGGGVSKQTHIFPQIHNEVQSILNKYIQSPQILDHIQDYIVPAGLGAQAGVLGALALAQQAFNVKS